MQIDVHDTYVRTTQGKLLHFDVLLPTGRDHGAKSHAREWLGSIGIQAQQISQESCRYCHSEVADPEIWREIKQRGYVIIQMEGCPTPIRSWFKTPQLALYGVKNRLKMLIYSYVNCAFSPIFALSCTHLRNFKSAS